MDEGEAASAPSPRCVRNRYRAVTAGLPLRVALTAMGRYPRKRFHLAPVPMIQLQTLGRVRLQGDPTGEDAGPASAQPKRVALLAYLALMSDRAPVRRDTLLALFWPELGDEEARRALRQALHYLRRVVGDNVLVGAGEELSVSSDRFRCDAVEFERLS